MPQRATTNAISEMGAGDLVACYGDKSLSPVEVVEDVFRRIAAFNPAINAYCHLDEEGALAAARQSEARWVKGESAGRLDGVPVSIKDLTDVAGMPSRKGSLTTDGVPAAEDAPFVSQCRKSGAVILGKTTTPEYGWKGVTDSRVTGITRNPWDVSTTPGGSSGGAAAAAALNLGVLHQGSDGGGSIRIPCGFTGTVGIKPTFGFIPQVPPSVMTVLSHLGPIGRNVPDLVRMIDVVAEPDGRDWYTFRPRDRSYPGTYDGSIKGLRIAASPDLGYAEVDPDVVAVFEKSLAVLSELGAHVERADPGFDDPIDLFRTFWFTGAARLVEMTPPEKRELMDPGLVDGARSAEGLTALDYVSADAARATLGAKMNAFHERFDLLVTPTLALTAFEAGRNTPDPTSDRGWTHWTPFSYPFNITQQPAGSVPCGLAPNGLPVGLHIVGPKFRDDLVLRAMAAFLEARPPVFPEAPVDKGH